MTVPSEENLPWTEYARHTVCRYAAMLQYVQIVEPELILYEKGHHRPDGSQEANGMQTSVERQIADDIGSLVILSHLVARGREESKQYLVFGMFSAQLFHQWTALFKLTQRGSMKPYVLSILIHLLTQHTESSTLTAPHLAYLLVEQAVYHHAQLVQVDNQLVHVYCVYVISELQ